MNEDTIAKLLSLNRQFYQTFSRSFSSSRQRIQPGVRRILDTIDRDEKILDLGCGNGKLANEIALNNPDRLYVGVDSNADLLSEAKSSLPPETSQSFSFFLADLSMPEWDNELIKSLHLLSETAQQSKITPDPTLFNIGLAFAVLHHIPGENLRAQILNKIHNLLDPDRGYFIHSEWQFLNSSRLFGRIQPWDAINLKSLDVDEGDYLLDWRQDGYGLRYVHHFTLTELAQLAEITGFSIRESFYSDGEGSKLGLYQVWRRNH